MGHYHVKNYKEGVFMVCSEFLLELFSLDERT